MPKSPVDLAPRYTRRDWLALGLTTVGALAARRLLAEDPPFAQDVVRDPSAGLVVRNDRPLDAEAPLAALATYETAADHFFVRSHFGPPAVGRRAWTLTIDGLVDRPTTFTLDDVRRLAARGGHDRARPVTLECAGNGRGVFALPRTSGVQWERGAVSTAAWTGIPLGALLERAGLRATASHLWMEGADHAPLATVPPFLRSIPRAVALGDALVAYAMHGAAISTLHGGPLRLIVPGWFGMASTKWLTRVRAMPVESDNYFMARGYRYADGTAVTTLRPKAVIASPASDGRVRAGRIGVRGQAWTGAGAGGIRAVDLSVDGGRTWRAARLVGPDHPGAWRTWEAEVELAAGPATLMARATDRTGAVQPLQAAPNPGGYGNNSIHRVTLDVA